MPPIRRARRPVSALSALSLALFAFSACTSPQNTFDTASDAAQRVQSIYVLVIVLASVIGSAVLIAMVWLMVRFRARPGVKARQIHGNNTLEIAWTVAPIVVLVVIGVPTVIAVAGAARDPEPGALHVNVTAHQWWWEFEYEGLGPNGGKLLTANELHLPIGRQVAITVESTDVIHSFWVPRLVGKVDAIPTRTTHLEPFTPNELGEFYGQCAEFCGSAHALMRFRVFVDSLADFERWTRALQTPPAPAGGVAAAGQTQFNITCGACHTVSGTVAGGKIGPDLTRFGSRSTLGAGILDNTDENLRAWIKDVRDLKPIPEGKDVRPPTQVMPTFDGLLTDTQIAAIAAYLHSMKVD